MQVRTASFPTTGATPVPEWIQLSAVPDVRPAFVVQQPVAEPAADDGEEIPAATEPPAMDPEQQQRAELAEVLARAEAEGRAAGEVEGRAMWEQRVERIDEVLADLNELRRRLFASMEGQMRELALCVAGTILERELQGDQQYVMGLVRQAVELVADGDEINISVNPEDLEWMASRLEQLAAEVPRAGQLTVRPDATVLLGCLVDTRLARVDATLASRLRSVAEALEGDGEVAAEDGDGPEEQS